MGATTITLSVLTGDGMLQAESNMMLQRLELKAVFLTVKSLPADRTIPAKRLLSGLLHGKEKRKITAG